MLSRGSDHEFRTRLSFRAQEGTLNQGLLSVPSAILTAQMMPLQCHPTEYWARHQRQATLSCWIFPKVTCSLSLQQWPGSGLFYLPKESELQSGCVASQQVTSETAGSLSVFCTADPRWVMSHFPLLSKSFSGLKMADNRRDKSKQDSELGHRCLLYHFAFLCP